MKNKAKLLIEALKKGVKGSQDVTSTVIANTGLAGTPVWLSKKRENKANYEADMLKTDRETKHLDLSDKDWRDPIFRARAEALRIKNEKKK